MELLCAINHPSPESASIAGEPLSAKQVPPHHGREYFCIIRDDLRRTHRAYRHAHLRNEDGAGPRALGTPTVGLSLGRYSRLTFGGSMTSGGPGLAATDGCCLRRLFRCLFCRAGPDRSDEVSGQGNDAVTGTRLVSSNLHTSGRTYATAGSVIRLLGRNGT